MMSKTPIKDKSIPPAAFFEICSFRKTEAIIVVIIGFVAAISDVLTLLVYFKAVKKNIWYPTIPRTESKITLGISSLGIERSVFLKKSTAKSTILAIRNLKKIREKTGNSIVENFPAMKAPEKKMEETSWY